MFDMAWTRFFNNANIPFFHLDLVAPECSKDDDGVKKALPSLDICKRLFTDTKNKIKVQVAK